MAKPKVHIKNWSLHRRSLDQNDWALWGVVTDHPRFDGDTPVTTSSIMYPVQADFSSLKDGSEVETRNTVYILVGENVNGRD